MRGHGRPSLLVFLALVLFQLSIHGTVAQTWLTLDGKEPLVIANGGHSGLYPHSSGDAFGDAQARSLPSALLLCDVRLTRDGIGICLPELHMENTTTIAEVYPDRKRNYTVNGVLESGWFSVDFTFNETNYAALLRLYPYRPYIFDGQYPILGVADLQQLPMRPRLWLNIQHDKFYTDQKLNMTCYLLNITRAYAVDFVSSPELSFLRRVAPLVNASETQIVFRFLGKEEREPSTGQTYGSLLTNLTSIGAVATGIIVPKEYIWPVGGDLQLAPASTSLVRDAHRAGLKVFSSGFANDFLIAYNYSYDPLQEYLSFVDNGDFSVDGVSTDFPLTASAAIACLSRANESSSGAPVVISYGGAGGMFPSCTDLAYRRAVDDGADYIDCPVQVTKDGVLVCLIDIDLLSGTTFAQSTFVTRTSTIPAIKSGRGAYAFNLTWAEIQTSLKPQISTPFAEYRLARNPTEKNAGAFLNLAEFLALAKEKPPRSGVLISIEHAPFLGENLGFDVTDGVLKALNASALKQEVIIQSSDSSVLRRVQQQAPSYKLMYKIEDPVRDVRAAAVKEIASFASLVALPKRSIYLDSDLYLVNKTGVVDKFKAENISVFAYLFQNEFVAVWWDAYADPIAEINTFVYGAGIDGLITEFPATAEAFRKSPCTARRNSTPPLYWAPIQPGKFANVSNLDPLPPAPPPLAAGDVAEPPLPSAPAAPAPSPPSAAPPAPSAAVLVLGAVLGSLLLV